MNDLKQSQINKRAALLATMSPQQILGYIAALMEISIHTQDNFFESITEHLSKGINITGNVEIDNTSLDVNVVGVEKYVTVDVNVVGVENHVTVDVNHV